MSCKQMSCEQMFCEQMHSEQISSQQICYEQIFHEQWAIILWGHFFVNKNVQETNVSFPRISRAKIPLWFPKGNHGQKYITIFKQIIVIK